MVEVEEKICAICQTKLENENQPITELTCDKNHAFHSECIFQWIATKNNIQIANCPICRTCIFNKMAQPIREPRLELYNEPSVT